MILSRQSFEESRSVLKNMYERMAKALELLEFWDYITIETEHNTFIGKIAGLKDRDLIIIVIAAREIDYKIKNLSSKGVKKRTYPLPLKLITSCKEAKLEEVPLYINFKYISPQFKNRYLK